MRMEWRRAWRLPPRLHLPACCPRDVWGGRGCSRLPPADRRLYRVVEAEHLAADLGGIGFGILLQQERRNLAIADREESLVCEQLDAAGGIEDVGDVDLLALGLVVCIGAERAAG